MRTLAVVFLSALFLSTLPHTASAQPAPSAALVSVLQRMHTVDVTYIIGWSADPRAPKDALGSINQVKTAILALDASDREAMLFWLRSHGRDALHQRGVTDAQIGPPLYPIDYEIAWVALPEGFVNPTPIPTPTPQPLPTPTPHPKPTGDLSFLIPLAAQAIVGSIAFSSIGSDFQRATMNLEFDRLQTYFNPTAMMGKMQSIAEASAVAGMLANEALKEHPTSTTDEREVASIPAAEHWTLLELGRERSDPQAVGIVVDNGVAGVRNYSEGAACLGFSNRDAKTVREIDFDFTLVDAQDHSLQSFALHRTGTFGPNERSDAPNELMPSAVAREDANCVAIGSSATGAPTIPSLSRAVAMAYEVRRVVFDDGTVWLRAGANLWPREKS
jgi:hypothetical protein